MLRLRSTELERLDGGLYYGGGLFSGVAFDEKNGVVLGARVFEKGVDVGDYTSPYIEVPEGSLRITLEHADVQGDPDMGPISFHGSPFEGMLYTLEGPFCLGETWFVEGWSRIDVEYHANGTIAAYDQFREQTGGEFNFDDSGELTEARVVKGAGDRLEVSFGPGGRLCKLDATGAILELEDAVVDSLPIQVANKTAELAGVVADDHLYLTGDAVDGAVLTQLMAGDGLAETRSLELYRTSLGAADLAPLGALPRLKRLEVADTSGELTPALVALKAARPELGITYNELGIALPLETDPAE